MILGALALSACAGTPRPEFPPWNPQPIDHDVVGPLQLPSWPVPSAVDTDGDGTPDGATYSLAQLRALDAYKITAEGNQGVAEANAQALRQAIAAHAALAAAGRSEAQVRDFYRELAEYERAERRNAVWAFRAALVALGLAVGW